MLNSAIFSQFYIHIIALPQHQQSRIMSKEEQSLYDVLSSMGFDDQIGKKLVLESILDLDLDQNQLEGSITPQQLQKLREHRQREKQKASFSAGRRTIQNIKERNKIEREIDKGIFRVEEDEGEFADDFEKGKRFRSYTYYEPPKFKILGYSKEGKPIFKMSDVFLTSDPIMRNIINKEINEIIYGRSTQKLETGDLSKKVQKNYDFEKLIQTWQKKQYEDFTTNKRNQMDQEELEEIVVNRGDEKNNYWIYKIGERNPMSWGQIYEGKPIKEMEKKIKLKEKQTGDRIPQRPEIVNHYLMNPKFKMNMLRIANQKRLQYSNIEEFEDSSESEDNPRPDQEQQKAKQKRESQDEGSNKEEEKQNGEGEEEEDEEPEEQDNDEGEQGEQDQEVNKSGQMQEEQFEKYEKLYDDERKKQREAKEKKQKKQVEIPKEKQVMILDDLDSPYPQHPQQPQTDQNGKETTIKYWGQEPVQANKSGQKYQNNTNRMKYQLFEEEPIRQTRISQNDSKNMPYLKTNRNRRILEEEKLLVEEIIKEYSIANPYLIRDYPNSQSLQEYNRVEYHLENPAFYLTKLHFSLQKKSEQFENFIEGNNKLLPINRNISNPSAINRGERSMISGSLGTGNQGTLKQNNSENMALLDEDHETIEQKILKQMNHHSRKPIMHSQVATKLLFIKFNTSIQQFSLYHRYQFKYDLHFASKVKVSLLRHPKPLKNKLSQLNINMQKIDSHKKFNKPEHLSLASEELKQFIMVQYIEENPLLMSDVGMCERMTIQVNNQEMLQKINNDIIKSQIDDIDENPMNTSTQRKMELWRENIKSEFGENGKVYLWESKRQSKVIGNPEGLGVSLMQSNLGVTPVVKKNVKKTDFLLVRDGNKWVLRKIDAVYTSGQVQPKQVVFTPDNRHYQSFLQNYQRDYVKKFALRRSDNKISVQELKRFFPNTPQTSAESRLRKILKNKMKATTKDNKTYLIPIQEGQTFLIKPEDYCLYQRMQKSLCELADVGIIQMKNMEKMKSILRKYFKKDPKDLKRFAIARMIRDQLQLTSWYLTESFSKFIDKKARIQMYGHADPTNGHGGYSYIKKPQKQRTDKDESQKKEEKQKLSGTEFDLRKLKAENSIQFLLSKGYSREEVQNKTRWQLVSYIKKEKDTEYARKQRQTKEEKQENQRKQRSKLFNTLLRNLKLEDSYEDNLGGGVIQPYQYDYNQYLDLDFYMERQKPNWINSKQNYERKQKQNEGDDQDDDNDEDS